MSILLFIASIVTYVSAGSYCSFGNDYFYPIYEYCYYGCCTTTCCSSTVTDVSYTYIYYIVAGVIGGVITLSVVIALICMAAKKSSNRVMAVQPTVAFVGNQTTTHHTFNPYGGPPSTQYNPPPGSYRQPVQPPPYSQTSLGSGYHPPPNTAAQYQYPLPGYVDGGQSIPSNPFAKAAETAT